MESIWCNSENLPDRKKLEENIHVQNAVIGAGMAGILTAYMLKKKGKSVIVIEADRIADGQTGNTTAKITSQHDLIYDELIKKAGIRRAGGYAKANEAAISEYEKIVREENIECHFDRLPSYLYTTKDAGKEQLLKEAEAAKSLGIKAHFVNGNEISELPFSVKGAVCFENQAQFHPLEFINGLSRDIEIYENTRVLSVHGHVITTDSGVVTAENIIFATHYPFSNVPGFYFLRQHQERSYVLALEGDGVPDKLSGVYYGIDKGGLSFRCAEGRLLFGGGSHRTGKKDKNCDFTGYSYIKKQAEILYPDASVYTMWAAQDCVPHDKIPFIGKYSMFRPYWYVATGFKKWGMTSSMVAAMIISDMISGVVNPYEKVFSPQRVMVRMGIKSLCTDIGESVVGLVKGLFGGKRHRCSHMGCHLEWNEEEHTWDCPCHGSRYGKDGDLIDNPAKHNLNRR
ncbi:MAG: FAD-dependent oxidoreductase [Lachnospiraceae bacterium]